MTGASGSDGAGLEGVMKDGLLPGAPLAWTDEPNPLDISGLRSCEEGRSLSPLPAADPNLAAWVGVIGDIDGMGVPSDLMCGNYTYRAEDDATVRAPQLQPPDGVPLCRRGLLGCAGPHTAGSVIPRR